MSAQLVTILVIISLISFNCAQKTQTITVAKDGSGQFRSVSEAVKSITKEYTQTIIKIKSGVYYERVNVSSNLQQVIFLGENVANTIIIHDTPGSSVGTFSSWSVIVEANDF